MNQNKSKSAIIISNIISKIQMTLGIILTAFFTLMTIGAFATNTEGTMIVIILFLIMLAIGILLIVKGKKRSSLIKQFKAYVLRLSNDPFRSIDNLAAATNSSVDRVRANVDQMIKKGYFYNAYIDTTTNCLVFAGQSTVVSDIKVQINYTNNIRPSETEKKYTIATCNGCGAMNKILDGSVGECEYCGSYLK